MDLSMCLYRAERYESCFRGWLAELEVAGTCLQPILLPTERLRITSSEAVFLEAGRQFTRLWETELARARSAGELTDGKQLLYIHWMASREPELVDAIYEMLQRHARETEGGVVEIDFGWTFQPPQMAWQDDNDAGYAEVFTSAAPLYRLRVWQLTPDRWHWQLSHSDLVDRPVWGMVRCGEERTMYAAKAAVEEAHREVRSRSEMADI